MNLRPAHDDDWPAILGLADAALPWDADGNLEWLENRKQFSGRRRHYVAEDAATDQALGYGAIEEGPDPGSFRMFIYEHLLADLAGLKAAGVWVREYAADTATLSFFQGKGFEERNRFALIDNREMVVMVKRLEQGH